MTKDLLKKLNTTGAFDTPWLREQLKNWNVVAEQKKADFMEHMYQVYKPADHCYTGLWQRFCIEEAGPVLRDRYFEMIEAARQYEEQQTKAIDKG
jgi:hypothetical protein